MYEPKYHIENSTNKQRFPNFSYCDGQLFRSLFSNIQWHVKVLKISAEISGRRYFDSVTWVREWLSIAYLLIFVIVRCSTPAVVSQMAVLQDKDILWSELQSAVLLFGNMFPWRAAVFPTGKNWFWDACIMLLERTCGHIVSMQCLGKISEEQTFLYANLKQEMKQQIKCWVCMLGVFYE